MLRRTTPVSCDSASASLRSLYAVCSSSHLSWRIFRSAPPAAVPLLLPAESAPATEDERVRHHEQHGQDDNDRHEDQDNQGDDVAHFSALFHYSCPPSSLSRSVSSRSTSTKIIRNTSAAPTDRFQSKTKLIPDGIPESVSCVISF